MTNDELERKISKAFSDAVPDVFDRVMRDIDIKQGRIPSDSDSKVKAGDGGISDTAASVNTVSAESDVTFTPAKKRKKGKLIRGFFAAAAAAAVVLGTVFGISAYNATNAVASTVSIDVNPSIEIKVNKDKKVLEVIPQSEDAVDVIGDMDFKGADLDVAIHALLGALISKGYLSEIANSILVSVDNADPATASALQDMLMTEIDKTIGTGTFSGAIIGQVMDEDAQVKALADEYGITLSKAQLIRQITDANRTLKFEDLVSLPINDLNLLKRRDIDGLTTIGTASDEGYIGAERAVSIALEKAGFNKDDTNFLRVDMDYENSKLCYDVSFHRFENNLDFDYDYNIDAVTGEIICIEKELSNAGDLPAHDVMSEDISEDEARAIAIGLAGVDESTIYEYELERDYDRVAHYDIEFKTGGAEYNYDLTMYDGTVIKDKWEIEQDYYPGVEKLPTISEEDTVGFIGEQKAKDIALVHAEVKEAATYDVEIELEREKGKIIYEVEFKSGRYSYSYDIEPITGEIIDYELNYDY